MVRVLAVFLILVFANFTGSSQSSCSVIGMVKDSTKSPPGPASISVFKEIALLLH